MARLALGIEYKGSDFSGWQKQQGAIISVQGALEAALSHVADESVVTTCAGRTDAGVHAIGQVVHCDISKPRTERAWVLGVNRWLPPSVRVLWAKEVPQSFNARRSALARRYHYLIYNHSLRPALFQDYTAWVRPLLDVQWMREASQAWLGEHDFSSFRAANCQSHSPVRCIHAIDIVRKDHWVVLSVTANSFLYHMVRNMVGSLLSIGRGQMPISFAAHLLSLRDRKAGGVTVPPNGLYLTAVYYPEVFDLPPATASFGWIPFNIN